MVHDFILGAAQVLLQVVMLVVREPQGPVAHHGVGTHEKVLDSLGFLLRLTRNYSEGCQRHFHAKQLVKVLGLHLEDQQTTS